MSLNILQSVAGLFDKSLVAQAASSLNESESGIQKTLSAAIPSVLLKLVNQSESAGGAANLLEQAKQVSSNGVLSNLSGLLNHGGGGIVATIAQAANSLFGDKFSGLINLLANFGGIKQSSASSLLNLVAPAALGTIGGYANEHNLSASGLSNLLQSEKSSILSALPSGFNLSGLLGLGGMGEMASTARQAAPDNPYAANRTVEESAGGRKWLPWLLALAALALIWFLWKGCNDNTTDTTVTDTDTFNTTATSTTTTTTTTTTTYSEKLPNGIEISAEQGGIEEQLITYLNSTDPADSISKSRWFDFNNLNFKTGSAELTDSSMAQINNIAAILKAFPNVKIKIGGYTDKTGNEEANLRLSQSRADRVLAAIKEAGANAEQLVEAEGYGSKLATVDASATDEERKVDRRISINVKAK